MTSQSVVDRLKTSKTSSRSSILPLHNPTVKRSASQYSMQELEPWPEDNDEVFHDGDRAPLRSRKSTPVSAPAYSLPRSPTPDAWQDETSSAGSPYRSRRSKPMFARPPPPVASSIAIGSAVTRRNPSTDRNSTSAQGQSVRQSGIGSLLFNYKLEKQSTYQPGSVWRGIRRREKALEADIQQFLDLQANGLVAGSNSMVSGGADSQLYSDIGSSTPTETFYSTATSKSRMVSSLYVPTRSTPDGNVIPVRQPKSNQPRGLSSARMGLRRSISALAQLKAEEDAHVDDALAERRKALSQLNRLSMRREIASTELHTLEEDEQEPLGQELRELGARYDSITEEIRQLEERLVGMRNQRRWLRKRMDDVQNRREAGLSGYRGTLKEVDSEVATLMRRPPIQPLDLDLAQQHGHGKAESTGGLEFLRLIPERRTVDMAKSWWESEISILEQRKTQIKADREALDEGGAMWAEVMRLVSDFESRLRQVMKGEQPSSSAKGKARVQTIEELIREQLPEMEKVVGELEEHQHFAEDKGWNLLICAISAELEAFMKAHEMLQEFLEEGSSQDVSQATDASGHESKENQDAQSDQEKYDENSDNEVPPDLLVSRADGRLSQPSSVASPEVGAPLERVESDDGVPPEFLAEHKDKSE